MGSRHQAVIGRDGCLDVFAKVKSDDENEIWNMERDKVIN